MTMDCEHVRDNIDAWALGALDGEEARALEAHIEQHDDCAALAESARDTAASIALAVPLQSANSALKARVLASAAVLSDIHHRRNWRTWSAAAAACVAAVAIVLISWSGYLHARVNSITDDNAQVSADATSESNSFATVRTELVQANTTNVGLVSSQDAVIDILSRPDIARVPLTATTSAPASNGRYIWSQTGGLGALVATNLPRLADGTSYCMWMIFDNAWVYGGRFKVDDTGNGRLIVRNVSAAAAQGRFHGFAVTAEPDTAPEQEHNGPTMLQALVD